MRLFIKVITNLAITFIPPALKGMIMFVSGTIFLYALIILMKHRSNTSLQNMARSPGCGR